MQRKVWRTVVVAILGLLVVSCAGQMRQVSKSTPAFNAQDLNARVRSGGLMKAADNFMIILDRSQTMDASYKGRSKYDLAKSLVSRMNQTIPDLALTGGLRTFGHGTCCSTDIKTDLVYGMTPYTQSGLGDALKTIPYAGGGSPLGAAIDAAAQDLAGARGKIAVIVFSDAQYMDETPVMAAKRITEKYGDRVCLYTVLIGRDEPGAKIMQRIADAGQCGFAVNGDEIASAENMAGFVEKVFLMRAGDRDGDGVADDLDKCPGTPAGVRVDGAGCPLDTDGDGVYDYLDKCPGTPRGAKVDNRGCTIEAGPKDSDGDGISDDKDQCPKTPRWARVNAVGCWVLEGVLFETAKWNIKPASYPVLDEVVSILNKNPDLKVEIQGHTDNRGSARYNQGLSENRARSVMTYLAGQGVESWRLSSKGYGFSKPAATNDTAEGRALNRRVELKPIW